MLYKIIPTSHFDKNNTEDCVKPLELDVKTGFMHLAFKHQIANILQKFFKEEHDLLILEIDPNILEQHGSELRIEANKPGGEKFPHLYGAQKIPHTAIKKIMTPEEITT